MYTLTLYHREDCHLCDDLYRELMILAPTLAFEVVQINIDHDPALWGRYNEKVPVLMLEDEVICCHVLNETALRQALNNE